LAKPSKKLGLRLAQVVDDVGRIPANDLSSPFNVRPKKRCLPESEFGGSVLLNVVATARLRIGPPLFFANLTFWTRMLGHERIYHRQVVVCRLQRIGQLLDGGPLRKTS
jgi:hypothetical protein